jgi:hypothetical protein
MNLWSRARSLFHCFSFRSLLLAMSLLSGYTKVMNSGRPPKLGQSPLATPIGKRLRARDATALRSSTTSLGLSPYVIAAIVAALWINAIVLIAV